MLYEKAHPLHDAVMQGGHINHADAVKRYQSLMRRAWDPAARSLPIKPLRDAANTDDRAAASIQAPSSRALLIPTGPATRMPGAPIAANDSARATASKLMAPNVASSSAPFPSQGKRFGKVGGTQIAQATPPVVPYRRPLPSAETLARLEARRQLIDGDRNRAETAVLGREQSLTEQNRGIRTEEQRMLPVPPHNIDTQEWEDVRFKVDTNQSLSGMEKYVHLRLFGYEGLGVDRSNPNNVSVGGIRNDLLQDKITDPNKGEPKRLYQILVALRDIEGKSAPQWDEASVSVTDLTVDELIDAQRIYLVRYLEGWTTAQQVHDSTVLDRLGSPETVSLIADTIFHHGPTIATPLLQAAVNDVVAALPVTVREQYDLDYLEPDGILGSRTRTALETLAGSPFQDALLLALRQGRAQKLIEDGNYTGNNRLRVWGLTAADLADR